ncbi:High mobility group nucleosome-binding domain-containing protein 5, partial [Ophiophagus hannah]
MEEGKTRKRKGTEVGKKEGRKTKKEGRRKRGRNDKREGGKKENIKEKIGRKKRMEVGKKGGRKLTWAQGYTFYYKLKCVNSCQKFCARFKCSFFIKCKASLSS